MSTVSSVFIMLKFQSQEGVILNKKVATSLATFEKRLLILC